MIKFHYISIVLLSAAIMIFVAPAYAQNQTQTQTQEWSTYEDPILGVSIQYPSSWEVTPKESSIAFHPYNGSGRDMIGGLYPILSVGALYPLPDGIETSKQFMQEYMKHRRDSSVGGDTSVE